MAWPHKTDECEESIERLRREQPGISSVEILMQLPQCASSADLPIDFLEIGRISDVAELRKSDTPLPEPEPEAAPEQVEETLPPPEPEAAEPEPEPEVEVPDPRQPEPPKKPEPKPEPKKEEPKPKPKPVEKPPAKPKDDLDFLNDLESTLQSKRTAEQRPDAQQTDRPLLANSDRDQQGAGARTGATASLQAALRRQIGECWVSVDDLPPEHQIDVTISLQLGRDGSLISSKLVDPRSRPVGRSGIAVDRALLAVRKCGETNYRLPPEDYELWKDISVTLGPKQG
ncbi:hypothetical protein K1X12_04700 [Hyphomonas sp. WL0036]|uniref:hypothetical protein n=1 Tax=Hyphomonas sediminis TaxID=2866160 RepID=UPI001C7E3BA8|nr:hypothetical protein [Hyphomonas sediminis]MBY9066185.1 hypothetical protein [Hyphomonas sediminis]